MKIEINVFYKELLNKFVWVAEINAIKNDDIKKTKVLKNFCEKDKLEQSLFEIKENFKSLDFNFIFKSNFNFEKDLLIDIFSNIELSELTLDIENKYNDFFIEMETLENDPNVPLYISYIPKTTYEQNLLLFRIAIFFDENNDKVFDFPLFLEMKKNKIIEDNILVEDFLEDLLEKTTYILTKE